MTVCGFVSCMVYPNTGLYSKKLNKVISFSWRPAPVRPPADSMEEEMFMEEVLGDDDSPRDESLYTWLREKYMQVRDTIHNAVMALVNMAGTYLLRWEGRVVSEDPDTFEDAESENGSEFLAMPYGAGCIKVDGVEDSPYQEELTDKDKVARIAEWFAGDGDRDVAWKRQYAFGAYHLPTWNCEIFVSFCNTTQLLPQDLTAEFEKGGGQPFEQSFLRENASLRSVQSEGLTVKSIF